MQMELSLAPSVDPLDAWCASVFTEQYIKNPKVEGEEQKPKEPEWKIDFTSISSDSPRRFLEIGNAWKALKEKLQEQGIYVSKYILTFSQKVTLQVNRYKRMETDKVKVGLFISTHGAFCYTFAKATGYHFGLDHAAYLTSLEAVLPESAMEERVKKVKAFVNRIHPNAWDDLKQKVLADPEKYAREYGATVTTIKNKFPQYVIDALKEAFENKTNYSERTYASRQSGRDLRVETKLCDDGIFRAWFSSEFAGCVNGDYWLLVNPTTAIFKERD